MIWTLFGSPEAHAWASAISSSGLDPTSKLQRSESSAVNLLTLGSTSLEPLARLHRPGGEPASGGSIRFAGSRRAPI